MLRGEYVTLRVPETDDSGIITGWQNDRDVTKYTTLVNPLSKKAQQDYIREIWLDKNSRTFIIETEDQIPIGLCSLYDIDWINSTAGISVVLYAKNCWGRGYGYDTVRTLSNYGLYEININTLHVKIIEGNERAIRCFEKAGYEVEGTLLKRVFKEGRHMNIVSMSTYKEKNREV